jgi:NAD(P)-dependent dehydrogenase (short-subunit alcohol dehydrogenase family)
MMAGRLEHKVAIVTGAASGIGRASAVLFAAEGAAVMLADWHEAGGIDAAQQIVQEGGRALFRRTDVSSEEETRALVAATVDAFGGLDILFNNAGIMPGGSIFTQTLEEWNRVLSINLTGMFLCARAAAPAMMARGAGHVGSIINTGSPTGLLGYPESIAYSTSKGGVFSLTRALAVELAPGIRVNTIVPGTTNTGILEAYLDTVRDRDAVLQAFVAQHPLGRICEPADVARCALFLASDDAAFVTGSMLTVDGGLSIAKGNPT